MRSLDQDTARPDVSVVIPARNEQGTIAEVIRRVDTCLADRGWSGEIILGDSACIDGTVEAALETGLPIRVVSATEPGKGLILTRAFMTAQGSVLAFIDADLDLNPEDLPRLIAEVRGGATAAIGTKSGESLAARPWHRRIASRVVNGMARAILRTGLRDHQTGMKAFARSPLLQILPEVVETGWLWDTEVLWRLQRTGGPVTEIPVTLVNGRSSSLRWTGGLKGARQILAMYGRMALLTESGSSGSRAVAAPLPPEANRRTRWNGGRVE